MSCAGCGKLENKILAVEIDRMQCKIKYSGLTLEKMKQAIVRLWISQNKLFQSKTLETVNI